MLPISEIWRISGTVDESWRSPVADSVAAAWGFPADSARWLRSSATHVFVIPAPDGHQPPAYLRFARDGSTAAVKLANSVPLLAGWAGQGLGAVAPIPSTNGQLSEAVETPDGRVVAMLVPAAAGAEFTVEDLSAGQAAEWGAALAGLHASGKAVPEQAPPKLDVPPVQKQAAGMNLGGLGDGPLDRAIRSVEDEIAKLDPDQYSHGICHGDFELDNIRFGPGGVAFFDADEAHHGWFAADVALAVRDLTGTTLGSRERPELLAAFLAGYRSRRAFTPAEEASLPLHSLAASARMIRQLEGVLDAGDGERPDWVRELDASLREHQRWHRDRLLRNRI
ncbi:phosphotransferase enzyme family protein [Pseudarthrobacter sp. CCNWLW207]|uniref:phosphotransferase enzyme family protein n=1 Tax=Pseudarthrobacter sp. CCNWLW207 TaxID=3127468 RepID=UPI003077D8D6